MECRTGEKRRSWFRSDRIYNMGGQWFFATREHQGMGPFASRDEAETEAEAFLRCLQQDGILAAEHYTAMRRRVGVASTRLWQFG